MSDRVQKEKKGPTAPAWLFKADRWTLGLAATAGAVALMIGQTGHIRWIVGLWIGAVWGLLNLHLWSRWVEAMIAPSPSLLKIGVTSALKFPVLYGGGYLALAVSVPRGWVEVVGVVVGVSLPLVVLAVMAVGRVLETAGSNTGPTVRQAAAGGDR